MNNIDFSSMINLAKEVLDILKKEYRPFLSREKIEWLENLDYQKLFKINHQENYPFIFFTGDSYYIKDNVNDLQIDITISDYFKENDIKKLYQEIVVFLCIALLSSEITPLKLGLIQIETKNISQKYGFSVNQKLNHKEESVAILVKEKLFEDLPRNIIFIENEIEIFNYLAEEKGIETANIYYEISILMQDKYKELLKNCSTIVDYLHFYNTINYDDVMDFIYEFIHQKIM